MTKKTFSSLILATTVTVFIAGCAGNQAPVSSDNNTQAATESPSAQDAAAADDAPSVKEPTVADDMSQAENTVKDDVTPVEDTPSPEDVSEEESPADADDPSSSEDSSSDSDKPWDVIWLGDSLTQGSLGDDNHNKDNPQAPWRVLGEISGRNVTGVGFYGYTAHDIFWAYGEYDGIKDPDITYVYWVGSNDFHDSPDNIKYVIEETDRFNANAGITKYLMLGTTNRGDMDPNAYIGINKGLEDHYGDRYLDIMPYVEFGPDSVHLTEASYRSIAEAVYNKLLSMNYL